MRKFLFVITAVLLVSGCGKTDNQEKYQDAMHGVGKADQPASAAELGKSHQDKFKEAMNGLPTSSSKPASAAASKP